MRLNSLFLSLGIALISHAQPTFAQEEKQFTTEELAAVFAKGKAQGMIAEAQYKIEYVHEGKSRQGTHSLEFMHFDKAKNIIVQRSTLNYADKPGQPGITYSDASKTMVRWEDASADQFATFCSKYGQGIEQVIVPAGTFQACKLVLTQDAGTCTRWMFTVVGGIVRESCKFADGDSADRELVITSASKN